MAVKSGATQDLVMESVLTLFFREITSFTKNFVKMISPLKNYQKMKKTLVVQLINFLNSDF